MNKKLSHKPYSLCFGSRFLFRLFFCIIRFLRCTRLLGSRLCSTLWRSSLRLIRFWYNLLFRFYFRNTIYNYFIAWIQTFGHNPVAALGTNGGHWTWRHFIVSTDQHRHRLTCWGTGQSCLRNQESIRYFTLYDLRSGKHTWKKQVIFVREYRT
ncbi:Uncharacterised protein [Mycobacteroides abscessus]|nr:Uncharacterised protein [Mycobacteroides abscessus]